MATIKVFPTDFTTLTAARTMKVYVDNGVANGYITVAELLALILTADMISATAFNYTPVSDLVVGQPSGVAQLDAGGLLPAGQFGGALNSTWLSNVAAAAPTNGQHLVYDTGTSKWTPTTAATVPAVIDDLTDVLITAVANNDFLRYDSGTSKWINEAVTVPATLSDLTDVDTAGAANTNILQFNSGTSLWEPATRPADGVDGTVWRDGAGVPSNALGVDGDYYLNDSNGDVYLKTAGTYAVVASIMGPTGSATMAGLTDVTVGTPTAGQSLRYQTGTSKWVAEDTPYVLKFSAAGTPITSQFLGGDYVVNSASFAANFSGSRFRCGTAPTGSFAIDVKKNGSTVGTITFAGAATTATFTTSGGTSFTVADGDYIQLVAPASVDATMADIFGTLKGVRT